MRRKSMTLGTIAGVLTILITLVVLFVGIGLMYNDPPNQEYYDEIKSQGIHYVLSSPYVIKWICTVAVGILGTIGASIVKWRNKLAGVFMLISAAATFFTLFTFVPFVLFLIAGIYAFSKDANVYAWRAGEGSTLHYKRESSRMLGMAGGIMALIIGAVKILSEISSYNTYLLVESITKDYALYADTKTQTILMICAGVLGVLSGGLAIFGISVIGKENKLSGALFIAASVLSLVSYKGAVNFPIFVMAAIFALSNKQPNVKDAYPVIDEKRAEKALADSNFEQAINEHKADDTPHGLI